MSREGNTVTVNCSSTHLTSFAVLVDVGGAQVLNIFSLWLSQNTSISPLVPLVYSHTVVI